MSEIRVGHGFDVHQLAAGRELILGGVKVEFDLGLEGHSDADVLTHAVMDALLGAAGLRDIGYYFPPSDEKYKNADSLVLLDEVLLLIKKAGVNKIINIDNVIIAEQPRMFDYIEPIKEKLAAKLGIGTERINIKATTTERLGFVGRNEGIAVSTVCLVEKDA